MSIEDWHGSDYWQRVNAALVDHGKRNPSCAHCGTRIDAGLDKHVKCTGCGGLVYSERAP